MALNITKDILFDRYGDIEFNYGDIVCIEDMGDIFYQNVISRIITNFGDYKQDSAYGADVGGEIGKPVSERLEAKIKNKILFALINDSFLQPSEINIITLSQNNTIFVRINITINQGLNVISEKLTINMIFNPQSGQIYATI
jgi:hypothetical protein